MATITQKIKLIIADDHPVYRSGMEGALKSMGIVSKVDQAANGEEVISLLNHEHYDIVLMDIKMKPMNGIETTEIISKRFPRTKVIALSMHDERKYIMDILDKGAAGYLIKNADKDEIKEAIMDVLSGLKYFSKEASRVVFEEMNKMKNPEYILADELLKKERIQEILFLLCYEFSSQEIGDILCLSPRTIEDYRGQTMDVLKIKNGSGLVKYAVENGISKDTKLELKFKKWLEKKKN